MRHYQKTLSKLEKQVKRHKPFALRWNLFKPMSLQSRLNCEKDNADEWLGKALCGLVIWGMMAMLCAGLLDAIPFFARPFDQPSSLLYRIVILGGFAFALGFPCLILACINHVYEMTKQQSPLSPEDSEHLNEILTSYPQIIPWIGAWASSANLVYGDYEKVVTLYCDLKYAQRCDADEQESTSTETQAQQTLKQGPLGDYLDRQYLNTTLPKATHKAVYKHL